MATFFAKHKETTEDIDIEVSYKGLNLLTSGIVFSSNGNPVTIKFDDVVVHFHFEEEAESKNARFETEQVLGKEKEMVFKLINFNSPFGLGKVEPVNLIYTDFFNLHISFMVHKLDNKNQNYQLTYSILYGEKE